MDPLEKCFGFLKIAYAAFGVKDIQKRITDQLVKISSAKA